MTGRLSFDRGYLAALEQLTARVGLAAEAAAGAPTGAA
jgi:hypothetical protein